MPLEEINVQCTLYTIQFQLTEGGKSSQIKHFQDKTNKTALPIIDLIDAMKTGVIDYAVVRTGSKLDGEVSFVRECYCCCCCCCQESHSFRIAFPMQSMLSTWLEKLEPRCTPYLKILARYIAPLPLKVTAFAITNLLIVSGEAQDGDDRVRQLDAGRHEVEEADSLQQNFHHFHPT